MSKRYTTDIFITKSIQKHGISECFTQIKEEYGTIYN